MPDVREMIGKVAERNGIRLDDDDPIFAVSTINQLMLMDAVEQMLARFRQIVKEFEVSAKTVDEQAGKLFADKVRQAAFTWRDVIKDDIETAGRQGEKLVAAAARSYTWKHMVVWGIAGVASGAILIGLGVALGRFWR